MNKFLRNQQGIVLPLVLVLIVVVTILGFAAISIADNQTLMVSRHQQGEQALHYAEAGIHHYLSELNKDLTFYKDAKDEYLLDNPAISFKDGFYDLQVKDPSPETPYVTVISTGWVKNSNIKRTIEVHLHKKDFLNNLITANVGSDKFWYTRRFARGDVVNGPLHVNGDLIIDGYHGEGTTGPIFEGPVTYSGNLQYIGATGQIFNMIDFLDWFSDLNNTTEFRDGPPEKVALVNLPASYEDLEDVAQHVYTGRTCIYINGSTLKIRNQNNSIETLTLPNNDNGLVIYVKGGTGNNKWGLNTANVYVSGQLDGRLTIAAENDIYITATNPTIWDVLPSISTSSDDGITYGITYAGLSSDPPSDKTALETDLKNCEDLLGLIANRNVRILHYNWPSGNSPFYWKNGDSHIDVAPYNINIHAVIYAVTGSFEYEEHLDAPPKGNINLVGSVTQYKTGPVMGFGPNFWDSPNFDLLNERLSGYGRNYWHDPRLMYDMPPSFLDPTISGWEMVEWQEVANP